MKQSINSPEPFITLSFQQSHLLSARSRRHKQDTEVACGLRAARSLRVLTLTASRKYGNEGSHEAKQCHVLQELCPSVYHQ